MRSSFLVTAACFACACGGSTSNSTSTGSSCTTLEDISSAVTVEDVAGEPPAPQGGAIVDGTYMLTRVTRYGHPTAAAGTMRATLRISGSLAETVIDGEARSATIKTSGTVLLTEDHCPTRSSEQVGFSATPTSVTAFIPGEYPIVETFTKH